MSFLEPYEPIILALHIIICIFLVITILLQAGKGADMGAAFGAGSSQTLFGARGAATFLSKITTSAAMIFLLTSVSLASIHRSRAFTGGQKSAVEEILTEPPVTEDKAPTKVEVPVTGGSEENSPE